jgi:hypothetical protein
MEQSILLLRRRSIHGTQSSYHFSRQRLFDGINDVESMQIIVATVMLDHSLES